MLKNQFHGLQKPKNGITITKIIGCNVNINMI